jgi:hypothetical protein
VRPAYVAFLYVLGFSSLVSGDPNGARIGGYLECLTEVLETGSKSEHVTYVAFSDSIVLTTDDDTEDFVQGPCTSVLCAVFCYVAEGNCSG